MTGTLVPPVAGSGARRTTGRGGVGAALGWSFVGWALRMIVIDRRGLPRLLVMGLGIGACTLVLLSMATIGPAVDRSAARADAMTPSWTEGQGLFSARGAEFVVDAGRVQGFFVDGGPDPATAPISPGTSTFPGHGELLVSPDLAAALASGRPGPAAMLPGTVVGVIDASVLPGPHDLFFYGGADLAADEQQAVGWGGYAGQHPIELRIWLVLVTGTVVVAVPLLLFVALAARLGAARRDRRARVLRQLGAGRAQLVAIAAIEAAVASVAGVIAAVGAFLVLRQAVSTVVIEGRGVQPTDLSPTLAGWLLVLLGVPSVAVVTSLLAGRAVVRDEDDAVGRIGHASGRPVRAWWRVALVAVTVALTWWVVSRHDQGRFSSWDLRDVLAMCAIVALALFSVAALVGVITDRIARRGRPGAAPWLLARRRLAAEGSNTTRPAAAMATVLAGAIALSGLLSGTQYGKAAASAAPAVFWGTVELQGTAELQRLDRSLATTDAVRTFSLVTDLAYSDQEGGPSLAVASCGSMSSVVPTDRCAAGAVVDLRYPEGEPGFSAPPYQLTGTDGSTFTWSPPSDVVIAGPETLPPLLAAPFGYLLSPAAAELALPGTSDRPQWVTVTFEARPDRVAEIQAAVGWLGLRAADLFRISTADVVVDSAVPWVERALLAAGIATLIICALGLWLTGAQQVDDRRRPFALARASGVPTSTLTGSAMLAALFPATVGVVVAVISGSVLSLVLQTLRDTGTANLPWGWIGVGSVAALAMTVLIAAGCAARLRAATGPAVIRTE